jgi:hypothetical protein
VLLHEISHHGLDAFASELAIGSVAPAHIGEALQLDDRIRVSQESLGDGLELTGVLAPDFSLTGVEVDGFRFHEPVAVATREALREPSFGIARPCFGAAGAGARLTHPQIEAVDSLVGNVDRLTGFPDALSGFTQLRSWRFSVVVIWSVILRSVAPTSSRTKLFVAQAPPSAATPPQRIKETSRRVMTGLLGKDFHH